MGGGPCDYCVSPSPFALDFGTLDFGTSDSGLTIMIMVIIMVIVLFNARLVVQHQPGQVLCPLEAGHQRHAAHCSILFDLKMFLRNAEYHYLGM